MGIPGFSTWLRQRYPEAFEDPKGPQKHDAVYIDLASTLHTVMRKANSKSSFHYLLHRRLDELIDSLGPSKRIVIAMDGPAPLAKLLEQRRRRKKEADKSSDDDGMLIDVTTQSSSRRNRRQQGDGSSTLSSLFLTTGTLFMLEVHNSLLCYIIHRLADPKYAHLEYEFSDSTVKGEGELKIISRLIQSQDVEERHAVIGADSDLLLMTMIASKPNVFVVDDLPKRKHAQAQKVKRHKIFKADVLRQAWMDSLVAEDPSRQDSSSLARDLTLIAILSSGNDYLPGCQGLTLKDNMRPGLWNLYLDMKRQPEWLGQNLTRTIEGKDADDMSQKARQSRTASTSAPNIKVKINYGMLAALLQRHLDQKYINVTPQKRKKFNVIAGNWDYGMSTVNMKKIASMQANVTTPQVVMRLPADASSYVKGIEWTLTMYSTGSIQDYRYSYPAAPPAVQHLIAYLDQKAKAESSDSEEDQVEDCERGLSFKEKAALQPLLPAACALALLPARSRMQAATALRHLMDADSPVAEIYAVCKECQRLAKNIRQANAELEEVRRELANLQDKLTSVGLDSESALEADGELAAAVEKWEAAGDPLRDLLRELSRSHHKHVMESHPYKPFPTDDLEDAVLSVPTSKYPFWERQLTRFGREIVYRSKSDAESSSANSTESEEGQEGEPRWLRECVRFAHAYPKIAKPELLKQVAPRVEREVLPLHPYMQPGGAMRLPPRRAFSTSVVPGGLEFSDRSTLFGNSAFHAGSAARLFLQKRGFHLGPCGIWKPSYALPTRNILLPTLNGKDTHRSMISRCAVALAPRVRILQRLVTL